MRIARRQASFGAGEFSPRTAGRTDLPQYAEGMLQQQNWITHAQGSLTRRPGFQHIGVTKTVFAFASTERASSTGAFDLNDVVYAEELGLWVAVGDANGTEPVIVWSDDNGITWTAASSVPNLNFNLNAVCWSGSRLVAVGNYDGSSKSTILYSDDGDTWTDASVAMTGTPNLAAAIWTGTVFIAGGNSNGMLATSADGATWVERSTAKDVFGLARSPGSGQIFALCGDAPTPASVELLESTDDGIIWSSFTAPTATTPRGIFFDDGYFYILADLAGSLGRIFRSTGSTSWTTEYSGGASTVPLGGSRFGAFLVAVGQGGLLLYSSDGGDTWVESSIETINLNACAFGNGRLVVVGDDDTSDAQLFTLFEETTGRRLTPFIGSTGNPYMMEMGHLYIRFWRCNVLGNAEQVESSPGTALEVTTPWAANDLAALQFAQANDVMYIAHPSYTPRKLTRTGETTFTLTDMMDFTTVTTNRNSSTFKFWDGPYLDENSTVTTLTLNTVGTGSKTLTASSSLFVSTDVGRLVRIKGEFVWGWGVITAYTNATTVTIYMVEDPNIAPAVTRWALGAWSATTGYPRCVAFYQQRLVFAATDAEPMRFWPSVLGDFEAFRPTSLEDIIQADNGAALTIASRQMLPIRWLEAGQDLFVGTQGGPFRIDGGEGINDVGPLNARTRRASGYGASAVLPEQVGDALIYLQTGKRIVRGLSPDTASDVLSQPDLTLLAEHVTQSGVEEMAFAATPSAIVWMRRADGVLIGMTLNPVTRLLAWHRHPFPGSLTGSTYPKVLSIAVLPVTAHDQLWCITRRTVNGSDVEHIEAMSLPFDSTTDDQEDACYLDAAVKYDGASTAAISGLDHLEGESVYAYADGIMQGPYTVASGAVTLDTAASVVWTGLAYDDMSPAETLPVRMAEAQNARVGLISTLVEVLDINGLQIGVDASDLGTLDGLQDVETYVAGTLKPLVTGDREHTLPRGVTATRRTVLLYPEGALPATVVGLTHMVDFDHV